MSEKPERMKPSNKVFISSKFALGEAETIFAKFTEDSFKVFKNHLQSNPKRDGNTTQPYYMDVTIKIGPVAASKPTDRPHDCKEATAGGELDTEKVQANGSEPDSKLLEITNLSVRIAENRLNNARVQRSRARHDPKQDKENKAKIEHWEREVKASKSQLRKALKNMESIFGTSLGRMRSDLASPDDPSTLIPPSSPARNSYGSTDPSHKETLMQQGINLAVHRVKSIRQASASNSTSMTGPPIVSILSKTKYISCGDHECTCVKLGPTVSVSSHNNMGLGLAIGIKKENSNDISKNDDQLASKVPDGQEGQPLNIKISAAIPRTTGYSTDGAKPTHNAITDSSQSIPPASYTAADEAPQPHVSEIPDILTIFNATSVEMEKIVHEALKAFGEVHDLAFTTGDKDAQTQSATAAGYVKFSEAQAITAAKDVKHTETQHAAVTEDDKHTEAQTATIPNKFHRTEVESISDSNEEGVLLLEVDDEEEWEVLGAARSIPK